MFNSFLHLKTRNLFLCLLILLFSSCPTPLNNPGTSSSTTASTNTTCPTCPTCPDPADDEDTEQPTEPNPAPRIKSYAVYYGPLDASAIQGLKAYELVIVHPDQAMNYDATMTKAALGSSIRELKEAGVIVIAYVSVGEDLRVRSRFHSYDAVNYPDIPQTGYHPDWDELRGDPRFYRAEDFNYVGPVLDPRGPRDGGGPLSGYYRWPSVSAQGWAPYYLDDADRNWTGAGDGLPDYNLNFGAFFVNVGDRLWYETLRDQTRSVDGLFGLDELMSADGLAFDGLFLDTVDTMGPNTYTNADSPVPSEFEWTAPGLLYFVQNLRRDYPGIKVVQNRGLFFFDPRLAHYRHSARGLIDFVMFESYRLDSDPNLDIAESAYYRENQKRIRQAAMVEASRPDGFQMLSLGYVAPSTSDEAQVAADVAEATASGFVHYITNPAITALRIDGLNARNTPDTEPPVWSSTGYVNYDAWPDAYLAPLVPRIGIGSYEWGSRSGYDTNNFRLYYDIALDRDPVGYVAYRFNLNNGTLLRPDIAVDSWYAWTAGGAEWQEFFTMAEALPLVLRVRPEYERQYISAPPVYTLPNVPPLAYWSEVPGIEPGIPYLLLLRAKDTSGNATGNINIAKLTIPVQ